MADVDEELTFETKADQVEFITRTNGDKLYITKLKLTQDQATSMAWLVNVRDHDSTAVLEFQVKVKEPEPEPEGGGNGD